MEYREFGRTAERLSRLGLGAMRLPQKDGRMDFDAAAALIRRALQCGINVIDTAHGYIDSEEAIGRSVADLERASFCLQTKCPVSATDSPGTARRHLEESLKRLRTDYIDFFLAHDARIEPTGKALKRFVQEAQRAQSEGLVRHIGFSSHDEPQSVLRLIDMGEFECMLVQHNLLDTRYTIPIAHGHVHGLGVSVMGPLAGGQLVRPTKMTALVEAKADRGVRVALRFVLSNEAVGVAFSGVGAIEQLDENIEIATNSVPLREDERQQVERELFKERELAHIYCSACGYCMPCPGSVNIPEVLRLAQSVRLYNVHDWARQAYRVQLHVGQGADQCFRCGECEPKCPQNLPIPILLFDSHLLLGGSVKSCMKDETLE